MKINTAIVLVFSMMATAAPSYAKDRFPLTVKALLGFCLSPKAAAYDDGFCSGYFAGAAHVIRHQANGRVCLPEDLSATRVSAKLIPYLQRRPDDLGKPAAEIIEDSLERLYPCQ